MIYTRNEPVTPAQTTLLETWLRLCRLNDGRGVRRSSLDAGSLRRFLSRLVLLGVNGAAVPHLRLTGSKRCAELGFDPRGQTLESLPADVADILSLGIEAAMQHNTAQFGLVHLDPASAPNAYMRLPLLGKTGRVEFILCHDEPFTGDKAQFPRDIHRSIHARETAIAA